MFIIKTAMYSNNQSYKLLTFVGLIIMTTLLMLPSLSEAKEIKPKLAHRLCGNDFVKMWKHICKLKEQRGQRGQRTKRNLTDVRKIVKPKMKSFLQDEKDAKKFLKSLHRQRRQLFVGGLDDATEECCNERCTYGEIAEYKC